MIVMVPSGLKNLQVSESLFLFPKGLGKGTSGNTDDVFVQCVRNRAVFPAVIF